MLRSVGARRAAIELGTRAAAAASGAARIDMADRNKEAWPCDLLDEPTDYLATKHPFPRDARIVFDEEPHIYYIDGVASALSATGLCGSPFEKFDKHKAIAVMKPATRITKYAGLTDDQIFDAWEDNRNEASRLGTKMHAAIEVFWNTYKVSRDPEIVPEMAQFLQFHQNEMVPRKIRPFRTEPTVFTEGLLQPTTPNGEPKPGILPGSVDFLGVDDKGEFWVLDWKRSKEIKQTAPRYGAKPFHELPDVNYSKYSLQLHLYREIFQRHYGIQIPEWNLYIVTFHVTRPSYEMIQAKPVAHLARALLDQFDVWGSKALAAQ